MHGGSESLVDGGHHPGGHGKVRRVDVSTHVDHGSDLGVMDFGEDLTATVGCTPTSGSPIGGIGLADDEAGLGQRPDDAFHLLALERQVSAKFRGRRRFELDHRFEDRSFRDREACVGQEVFQESVDVEVDRPDEADRLVQVTVKVRFSSHSPTMQQSCLQRNVVAHFQAVLSPASEEGPDEE